MASIRISARNNSRASQNSNQADACRIISVNSALMYAPIAALASAESSHRAPRDYLSDLDLLFSGEMLIGIARANRGMTL